MTAHIFVQHECDNCHVKEKGSSYPRHVQIYTTLTQKPRLESDLAYSLPTGWTIYGFQTLCHACSNVVDRVLEKILEVPNEMGR